MTEYQTYEEWLTIIANTRLLYNTSDELGAFLETASIRSNGIKRCFTSLQGIRSAFRDLKCEVEEMTDGSFALESVLFHYKKAWRFYQANLARRSDPAQVVLELLRYYYPPISKEGIGAKKEAIFKQVAEQDINIPFLVLMMLKCIPGINSNVGDATGMDEHFSRVTALLEQFTQSLTLFSPLPIIEVARAEQRKTRLMLLFHVNRILDYYQTYVKQTNLYDFSKEMQPIKADIRLGQYWNECQGTSLHTHFWETEHIKGEGSYFVTHWHKDAEGQLTGICYTLFFFKFPNGQLVAYLIHPESIKHRMKGLPYGDADHVWYQAPWPSTDSPTELTLTRMLSSKHWPSKITLSLVEDSKVVNLYESWKSTCHIVKPFAHLEYDFRPYVHAVTHEYLYIPSRLENLYYQIPKASIEGLEKATLQDNMGSMLMNGREYLVFDELLLFIPTTRTELKKYGIQKVDHIE